jgi:hypothetical protein
MQTSCEVPPDVHFSGLSEKLADLSATLVGCCVRQGNLY